MKKIDFHPDRNGLSKGLIRVVPMRKDISGAGGERSEGVLLKEEN